MGAVEDDGKTIDPIQEEAHTVEEDEDEEGGDTMVEVVAPIVVEVATVEIVVHLQATLRPALDPAAHRLQQVELTQQLQQLLLRTRVDTKVAK